MSGLIDYAGLFPPAALNLDPAIRNYAKYQTDPDCWMLSTFICPAARLVELSPYVSELYSDSSADSARSSLTDPAEESPAVLRVSALAARADSARDFADVWVKLLEATGAFESAHGNKVRVDAIELAVPVDLFDDSATSGGALADWIRSLHGSLRTAFAARRGTGTGFGSGSGSLPTLFLEPPRRESWEADVLLLTLAIAKAEGIVVGALDAVGRRNNPAFGFKLRCGGVVASAFPSVEEVAFAIHQTALAGIAFKGTAGLHHPLRHENVSVQTRMHGFLNVFGASLLARARSLSLEQTAELLADENPHHFVLSDECFCWKDYAVTEAEISSLRDSVTSYGSCSFDEPREDLRDLNIL